MLIFSHDLLLRLFFLVSFDFTNLSLKYIFFSFLLIE